jgi:hypothetical protein
MKQLIPCIILSLMTSAASAQDKTQNKLDLQDVTIKGEATRAGMGVSSRARNTLDGRILQRKDFRDRILEELPEHMKKTQKTSAN